MHFYTGMSFCHLNTGHLISNELSNLCFINVWKFPIIYSYTWPTCLRLLKRDESESRPCMLWSRIVLDRDFELPGFPTRNNGIRSSTHTTIMKKFSLKARFFAMLSFNFKFCKKAIWHLFYEAKKNIKITHNFYMLDLIYEQFVYLVISLFISSAPLESSNGEAK